MEWNHKTVETKIGINFKNSDTLRLALMHRSYAQQVGEPENHNERLELLGNAIFNFVITDYLYHNCPYLTVSNLSALRNKLLEGERLTKLWFQLGLGEAYPFLGMAQERHILRKKSQNPFVDALEALVGAIHLDRGFSQTRNWLTKNLIAPLLERHLKSSKKRSSATKQLKFLGDSLLRAIITDYLYCHLPSVSVSRLTDLFKELSSSEKQAEYASQITTEDLLLAGENKENVPVKSLKNLLAAMYIENNATDPKSSFSKTSEWFVNRYIDGDEVLQKAITLLLEEGKPQKWIIREVMGYESKDYHEGRDRFNTLIQEPESEESISS